MTNKIIPAEISSKLRASYYFMGALLAKYKYVEMNFPGGCKIGSRPINLHLEGFKKLGATIEENGDKYIIKAEKLKILLKKIIKFLFYLKYLKAKHILKSLLLKIQIII